MKTIAACVPVSHICPRLNRAFRTFGIKAKAFTKRPSATHSDSLLVEHFPCPIEPTAKAGIWVVVDEGEVIDFTNQTFMNEAFVSHVIDGTQSADDMMAMECLMAASAARTITQQAVSARKMYQAANTEGDNPAHQHLAERVLGIPSFKNLLIEFVDDLLASAISRPMQSAF